MNNDTKGVRPCEQAPCGKAAEVYAVDPLPNGWGGNYCEEHADALRFRITDRYCSCTCGCQHVLSPHEKGSAGYWCDACYDEVGHQPQRFPTVTA